MIVAIHQPNFLPWSGYFYKLHKASVFVFLDNVQFTKNSFQNRVKIKTSQGEKWLTIPVLHKFGQTTRDVKINNNEKWREKHLKGFKVNYGRSAHFETVYSLLSEIYFQKEWDVMADFNITLIRRLCNYIGIQTTMLRSSSMDVSGSSTELLIDLIKKINGRIYLSGKGGANYQDVDRFGDAEISIQYTDFEQPVYTQLWGEFVAGLSIVDLLFNCGEKSLFYLLDDQIQ